MFFDTGNADYPIHRNGSCFLVTFRHDLWIVTAAHVVRNHDASDARVLRTLDNRRPEFFELASVLVPIDQDPEDTAWLDMVLIRSSDPTGNAQVIDLDRAPIARLENALPTDYIRVVGFPHSLGTVIDHENRTIETSSFANDGHYAGNANDKWMHLVRFDDFAHVLDVDGMSGGPAFLAREREDGGAPDWAFAGVVTRGSVQSGIMRFVDARKIVSLLTWHYDRDPNASVDAWKRRRG